MAGCATWTSFAGHTGVAAETDNALTLKWITTRGLATQQFLNPYS